MSEKPSIGRPPGPKRCDAYEKQLTDGELLWLHAALLDGKLSRKQIQEKAPKWREGRLMGNRPSTGTLSNIAARLELEEDLRGAEATTETIVEEMAREHPEITQEQLDAFGLKTFTTLSIQSRDVKSFVALQRAQKDRKAQALDEVRFKRETCELFLKWAEDQRARDIATSPVSNADKINQLATLMFGEGWQK